MDEAEIVSGVEVTNGPVHETGQQTAVKSAEVRYSIYRPTVYIHCLGLR